MSKLGAFKTAQQISLDDALAEFRAEAPPESVTAVKKEPSVITAGPDQELQVATKEAKKGIEPHNGLCPYTQECETRRQRLPTYRQYQPCHWVAWGDWRRCPIYRNGGSGQ
jgi:hypothetical protein